MTAGTAIVVAEFPAIRRDLYLTRCVRRVEDKPDTIATMEVGWADMSVRFTSDAATVAAVVEVSPDIPMTTFTKRLESLLDCGAAAENTPWVLKFSAQTSRFGGAERMRQLLFDAIQSIDPETGETVGVMKLRRRSVQAGHAKLRLVPADGTLQVVVRHTSAQGVKALWKSVYNRLQAR